MSLNASMDPECGYIADADGERWGQGRGGSKKYQAMTNDDEWAKQQVSSAFTAHH